MLSKGNLGKKYYISRLYIFLLFVSGKFNIFVDTGSEEKLVGSYDNQGSFGELALMYNLPRAATIQVIY